MSWERILKKDQEQWADLSEVILGEFDYEVWKDKPIPEGFDENDTARKEIFFIVTTLLEAD